MPATLLLEGARTRVTLAPSEGGRIAQIEALHHGVWTELLHGVAAGAGQRAPDSWGSFVMAPWPNRIAGGRFGWRGEPVRVPPNAGAHAIHGVCFDRPWTVREATARTCVQRIAFDGRWPPGGYAVQRTEVLDDGVAQVVEIHATERPFPAGAGWHPWIRRAVGDAEHVHVQVDADRVLQLDGMIPTGKLAPVDGARDLRRYPPLGDRRLDDCYVRPRGLLRLRWVDLELWMESSDEVAFAVVYTPEHAVCIEPQTCAIDAFNLAERGMEGAGVAVVEPGRPLVATTTWRWASV